MKPTLRSVLPWLLVIAVGAITAWLRYGLVESPEVAHACEAVGTLTCQLRQGAVMGFILGSVHGYQMGIYGWTALATALLALFVPRPLFAWLAAASGIVAVLLYCAEPGAFALLVGCFRLMRLQQPRAI